jgi:type VI secretion system protein ImpF
MAVYGLTDFTGMGVKSPGEQKLQVNSLETAMRLFEPRLMDLCVNLEPIDEIKRVLRFRIEARLKLDPVPEPITFDTVLQMGSGQFEVVEK